MEADLGDLQRSMDRNTNAVNDQTEILSRIADALEKIATVVAPRQSAQEPAALNVQALTRQA